MSIQSEISRISGNVSAALDAIADKGVSIPLGANSDNLATLVEQIQTGTSIAVEPLSVTQNGTYTAPSGTAYSPVSVNVSGGGGGSDYTFVTSEEIDVSTTSSSATTVLQITLPDGHIADAMYYVKIRDKAGKRNGYFFGADHWFVDMAKGNGSETLVSFRPTVYYAIDSSGKFRSVSTSSTYAPSSSGIGVFASTITKSGLLKIQAQYSSSYGKVDGTFVVEVYKLKWPNDESPLL